MNSTNLMLILKALMILFFPIISNVNEQYLELDMIGDYMNNNIHEQEEEEELAAGVDNEVVNEESNNNKKNDWFEQEVDSEVKWCFALNNVEYRGASEFQNLTVLSTKRFGKALVIDGHLQNTELDEYIFHESLVHPSLLIHNEPKTIFIMGGGGGSAAREVLKHNGVEKVIICDNDRNTASLIREHMTANQEVFNDKRIQIVYNDAEFELEKCEEKFDVIIGDLPDLDEPASNHLYTEYFYEDVAKPNLKENGIFVTQAGPAGIFTHKAMFSPIFNTLQQVFTYVVAYTALVPSYGDVCGFIMASSAPIDFDVEQLTMRIGERIGGELKYLDGPLIAASSVLNKTLENSLVEETKILTEENVNIKFARKGQVCNYPK